MDKEVRKRQINYVKSQLRDQDVLECLASGMISTSGKTAVYSQLPWYCRQWVAQGPLRKSCENESKFRKMLCKKTA